ncbi:MAG TPA: ABC transporter permease [Haloplasmataceae bacterium]
MVNKIISKVYLVLMFTFLYAPIFILIFFSFNSSKSMGHFTGFSLKWYVELWNNTRLHEAFFNTVIIAVITTIVSTIFGTITAIGIYNLSKRAKSFVLNTNYIPIINPDIVTAVSLMILYMSIQLILSKIGIDFQLGFFTMLLSHIVFSLPYVILSILPRLYALNPNIVEVALDLGATPNQAIRKVVIPEIMPGIIAGALIAFTMSIDDFVISYFTTGNGVTNISIEIYSMAKRRITPDINALASIMVILVIFGVTLFNIIQNRKVKETSK